MSVIAIPTSEITRQEAVLNRDVDALIDAFQELHEVERMTGRTGLSARVRLSIMNIMQSADKAARAKEGRR